MRPLRLALAACLAVGIALPHSAEELNLTLSQARDAAVRAGLAGNATVAGPLAAELLKVDPRDARALLAMSTVHLAHGAYSDAYRTSRRAFRFSDAQVDRFQAARVAAVAATADKRLMHAQFWLRRAGDLAPTPVDRAKVERNFRLLRAETPWRYKFSFSATPSDNVNGGSDHAVNVIEGVPFVGVLDGAAMALSGVTVQSNATFAYRFRRDERSQSEMTGGVYIKRVRLSEEAKLQAPGYDAGALGLTVLSFGVAHTHVLGKKGTVLRFEGSLRDAWRQGDRDYSALTGAVTISRKFFERVRLTARASGERRFYDHNRRGFVAAGSASASYTFGNGSVLTAMLGYTETQTPLFLFDSRSAVAKLSYTLGEPVLGVRLTAGVGASYTDYPDYSMIIIPVPGGRQDESLFFDLDATFTQVEYAGFSPTLRVRRAITESNVSRFATSEWAVSLGIESNF